MREVRRETAVSGKFSLSRLLILTAGLGLVLSGCAAPVAGSQRGADSTATTGAGNPTSAAGSPSATGAPAEATSEAAAFAARFTESLNALASRSPQPDEQAFRAVFVEAGAEEATVEVSADTTPTGLEVDAMTGAVSIGDTCVYGHIRNGAATVTELPALSNGQCFVGEST